MIRKATTNHQNIDHLMKSLFLYYGGTSNTCRIEELIGKLSALQGEDQTDFFDRYVLGTQRIPIEEFISMSALDASLEDEQLQIRPKSSPSKVEQGMTEGLLGQ